MKKAILIFGILILSICGYSQTSTFNSIVTNKATVKDTLRLRGKNVDSALTYLKGLADTKVTANTAIVGSTKTKITYDASGLVISGTLLTAGDIPTIGQGQVTGLTSDLSLKRLISDTAINSQSTLSRGKGQNQIDSLSVQIRNKISSGYGITYNSTTGVIASDTSSYHTTANYPIVFPNDSTINADTLKTNGASVVTQNRVIFLLDSLKGASWFGGSSSQWTTITNDIYYNTGRVLIGGTSSPASHLEVRTPGVGTVGTLYAPTNGISIVNSTAATVSQNQEVVIFQSEGQGWKTNATAGSQYSGWKAKHTITNGAANPTSTISLDYSINRATSTTPFQFGNTGNFVALGSGTFNGISSSSGGTFTNAGITVSTGAINYTENASTAQNVVGLSLRPVSAASSAGNTQYSPLAQISTNVASNTTNYFGQWGIQAQGTFAASGTPINNLVFMNRTTTTATGSYTPLFNIQSDGSTGIGITAPTGALSIKAGTTNIPPIVLTSGTNTTSVINGSIEYDGTDFFASASGTRQTLKKGKAGSISTTGTATTTFTVTFGGTQPNTTYKVFIQPRNALTAVMNFVTNTTTTTFDVTFATALTGTVAFDWHIIQ